MCDVADPLHYSTRIHRGCSPSSRGQGSRVGRQAPPSAKGITVLEAIHEPLRFPVRTANVGTSVGTSGPSTEHFQPIYASPPPPPPLPSGTCQRSSLQRAPTLGARGRSTFRARRMCNNKNERLFQPQPHQHPDPREWGRGLGIIAPLFCNNSMPRAISGAGCDQTALRACCSFKQAISPNAIDTVPNPIQTSDGDASHVWPYRAATMLACTSASAASVLNPLTTTPS